MSLTQSGSAAFFFRLSLPFVIQSTRQQQQQQFAWDEKGRKNKDSNNLEKFGFHILLRIEIIVELVVAINQLLQFCGELLSYYRLIQQLLWGRLGFILLTTNPDHCKCSMVWSVLSYVVVSNKATLFACQMLGNQLVGGI